MSRITGIAGVLAILCSGLTAEAAFITALNSSSSMTSTVGATNIDSLGGTVSLNATINSPLNQPVSWNFNVFNTGAVGPQSYQFTVNMTHNIPGGLHALQQTRFVLSGGLAGAGAIDFNYAVNPTSTYNAAYGSGLGATTLIFGGLQGGGGDLYFGQTATFTFTIDVPNSAVPLFAPNQSFTLTMVPNPEPTTLLLSAIPLAAAGFWARRRRVAQPTVA